MSKPGDRRASIMKHEFEHPELSRHVVRLRQARDNEGKYGLSLQILFLGIAVIENKDGSIELGYAIHDGTYTIDFQVETIDGYRKYQGSSSDDDEKSTRLAKELAEHIISSIANYAQPRLYKFVGAGITPHLARLSPQLAEKLWAELDIVCITVTNTSASTEDKEADWTVDEIADSMSRKLLCYFGPTLQPRLLVGYRDEVGVDVGGRAPLTDLNSYKIWTGSQRTWDACMKYCERLKSRKVKIAFFNSTPQGGGVALMRHALVRFFRVVGVDCKWYVPKPKPEVFRITKTNHNILQGVAEPKARLTKEQQDILDEWCHHNAERLWTSKGGPLASREDGGADIVIIDDPQLPGLVQISKKLDSDRPVIFRSHIQVRADLVDQGDNPTAEVWDWVWRRIEQTDLFISHPVREFVPGVVPVEKVGYMPATTDWVDGLNKELNPYESQYYINEFNTECYKTHMPVLDYSERDYIVQIARFDPSKGIPDVLEAYAKLRRHQFKGKNRQYTPQLVLAGHAAVDDPDATIIYEEIMQALESRYKDIREDICVVRLGPVDQLLNALMSQAKVALQLSTREGFEVKVSEALHKGTPIIATLAGGIPLQVVDGKSGYLVEVGDSDAVAKHLHDLFMDDLLYERMSSYAAKHVSDEVSTIGNALCWAYLADHMTQGKKLEPKSAWISDMARDEVGLPYREGENRLQRKKELDMTK